MKIRFITLLLIMAAAFGYGQTNATFNTIDVRTRETFRGPFYIYDTTYFKPSSVNIPFLGPGEPLGWFLTTSKGAEAKLVRVTIDNLIDSIGPALSYWTKTGNDIANNNTGKITIDSLYLTPLPPLGTKVGRIPILETSGQVKWMYPLSIYGDIMDSLTDSPTGSPYSMWLRDTTNGEIYPARLTDQVGIGTADPAALLEIKTSSGYETVTTGTELVDGTGWVSTGWTGSYAAGFTHTAGNTNPLIKKVTYTDSLYYQILFTISGRTAGQVYVTFGGESSDLGSGHKYPDVPDGAYPTTIFCFGAYPSNNTDSLKFIPTSTFDGKISNISVKEITAITPPSIIISNSDTDNVFEYRSTGSDLGNMFFGVNSGKYALEYNDCIGNVSFGKNSMQYLLSGFNNTAVGDYALGFNRHGQGNTAIGYYALKENTGDQNTGIGAGSLTLNKTGRNNVAVGVEAMKNNSTGQQNTAIGGYDALHYNSTGSRNVAVGEASMLYNVSGSDNVSVGAIALYNNTASGNTAIGSYAGYTNTSGTGMAAFGFNALKNSTGNNNSAFGYYALLYNNTGFNNVAVGYAACLNNTTATGNIGIGKSALETNSTGSNNTAVGNAALYANTSIQNSAFGGVALYSNNGGAYNTSVGYASQYTNSSGSYNTSLGYRAGYSNASGSSNIFIGSNAGYNETGSNKLYIENSNSATPLIWGDFAADSVVINGDLNYGDTYWKDATVSAYSLAGGVNSPTLQAITGTGIYAQGFNHQTANDEAYGQAQINHDYKLGTDIEAHVHWSINTSPASGSDTVVIEFEYAWADIDEQITSTTVTKKIPTYRATGGGYHRLSELVTTITGNGGDGLSSIIWFRIERLQTSASDTYADWWLLHDVDFHYQIDSPGSDLELIK